MLATKSKWAVALSIAMAALVAGCGGDDDEPTTTPMSVKAAKGAVVGATCTVSDPVEETVFETEPAVVITGADGTANFDILGDVPENSVILVSCANGEYFNEASGEFEPVEAPILSMLSSTDVAAGTASVAVTPLTGFAANLVLALIADGVTVDAHAADSANEEVGALFGIADITVPPTTINDTTPTLGTGAADAYALALASIAIAAASQGLDPFEFVTQIEEDVANGTVDTESLGTSLQVATTAYVDDYVEEGATIPQELEDEVLESQDPDNLDGDIDVEPVSGGG